MRLTLMTSLKAADSCRRWTMIKSYNYIVASETVIEAGQRKVSFGIRKSSQLSKHPLRSTRERLGIIDVEREINFCDWIYTTTRGRKAEGPFRSLKA